MTTASADAIRQLHDASGLDWGELASLFGVSRNALHLWARGGLINPHHATRIEELTQVVAGLRAHTPAGRRLELYLHPNGQRSLFEQLLADAGPKGAPLHSSAHQLYP